MTIVKSIAQDALINQAEGIVNKIAAIVSAAEADFPEKKRALVDEACELFEQWDEVHALAAECLKKGWISSYYYKNMLVSSTYPGHKPFEECQYLVQEALKGAAKDKEIVESNFLFLSFTTEKYFDVRPILDLVNKNSIEAITGALDMLLSCYFKFKPHCPTSLTDFDSDEAEALEVVRQLRATFENTSSGHLSDKRLALMEDDWGSSDYRIDARQRVLNKLHSYEPLKVSGLPAA